MNNICLNMALTNMKNNTRHYRAYLSINAVTVMFVYLFNFIANNKGLAEIRGGGMLRLLLFLGIFAVGIFTAIFQFYINGFLMKRRKKEYGLYSILGLEKKHISKIMLYENTVLFFASLITGFILGMLSGKVVFVLLGKLMKCDITIDNSIRPLNLMITALIFFIVSTAVYLYNVRTLYKTRTIDMLKGASHGQKQSRKQELIQLITGLLMIIAACVKLNQKLNIFTSMSAFFIMLMMILFGTYLVYGSMCSIVLNLLRRSDMIFVNKNRYFPVSNMIFRCRQTATGLASICIILTIISVVMTTTVSLYAGTEALVKDAYAYDGYAVLISNGNGDDSEISGAAADAAQSNDMKLDNSVLYHILNYITYYDGKNNINFKYSKDHDVNLLSVVTLEDYNSLQHENRTLSEEEILVAAQNGVVSGHERLVLCGKELRVAEYLSKFQLIEQDSKTSTIDDIYIIVSDEKVRDELMKLINTEEDRKGCVETFYEFGSSGNEEDKISFENALNAKLSALDNYSLSSFYTKSELRRESYLDNSVYLFIGFFLSLLFLGLMLIVMYHKQLQEAVDDAPKYKIMRKIGCSEKQCRKMIFNQSAGAYFIPIILSGIYSVMMFNTIRGVLKMFMLGDDSVIIKCMAATYVSVLVIYIAGYIVSNRVYTRTALEM